MTLREFARRIYVYLIRILSFLGLITCSPRKEDATLVAYYPFNGNASDESGNGNDGEPRNGASLTTDQLGNEDRVYTFDGEDDNIVVPTDNLNLPIEESLSLAAWVYPEAQKTQHIVRKGAAVNGPGAAPYGLSTSATGDIIFELRPNAQLTQVRKTGYPLNAWIFIAGAYDETAMRLYVNGQLENLWQSQGRLRKKQLHCSSEPGWGCRPTPLTAKSTKYASTTAR